MRDIDTLIFHISDLGFGTAEGIDRTHKRRGWEGIGYHYVIENGRPSIHVPYDAGRDGLLTFGRPLERVGAHAYGLNSNSIGVCWIGKEAPSKFQVASGLALAVSVIDEFGISIERVLGHYETPHEQNKSEHERKTCPNYDMREFRKELRAMIERKACQ